jgi:3-methyl-2-oxobutanoate hydroxymethyltransferase
MGTLGGFPSPPALWLRRAKPGYANAFDGNRAEQSSAARARAKPEGRVGEVAGPECRRPPHAVGSTISAIMATAKKVTSAALRGRKGQGDKIAVVTAYDVAFARLAERAGIDVVLVGDSLGMVMQGLPNTLPVTLDEMIYHCRMVARGVERAHVVADMPFLSYQAALEDGVRAAGRLLKDGRAEAVKLEGGAEVAPLVARLTAIGIPVMGHVGMTPQSVHKFGGFVVQGRTDAQAQSILAGARALADAGAYAVVIENVPSALAAAVTQAIAIPTIGIGAGPACDGQVLVMHDLLGLDPDWSPRFARRYAELGKEAIAAFAAFAADVRSGKFPANNESAR